MTRRLLAVAFAAAASISVAQPPDPCICPPVVQPRANAGEVRRYSREAEKAYNAASESMDNTLTEMSTRLSRKTVFAGVIKDEFGDPMYADYGPRAYAGTPCYVGPAYDASFERPTTARLTPDSMDRRQLRDGGYTPGLPAPFGSRTWPGASHSYLQSGMVSTPNSMAPSGDRPAIFNHN